MLGIAGLVVIGAIGSIGKLDSSFTAPARSTQAVGAQVPIPPSTAALANPPAANPVPDLPAQSIPLIVANAGGEGVSLSSEPSSVFERMKHFRDSERLIFMVPFVTAYYLIQWLLWAAFPNGNEGISTFQWLLLIGSVGSIILGALWGGSALRSALRAQFSPVRFAGQLSDARSELRTKYVDVFLRLILPVILGVVSGFLIRVVP
jgi:hypothetical protein